MYACICTHTQEPASRTRVLLTPASFGPFHNLMCMKSHIPPTKGVNMIGLTTLPIRMISH